MNIEIHPKGLCESKNIGQGTKVHAFTHILANAVIGKNCTIEDHVFIENDVIIGDRVIVKSGVQIWDRVTLEDDVYIGPNATFTNERFPRSGEQASKLLKTRIGKGASVGANATLLPGVTIHPFAMVGAGTVVTKDIPPYAIVVGNPARIIGYAEGADGGKKSNMISCDQSKYKSVNGVKFIEHSLIQDLRGDLTVGEFENQIPFPVKRYFMVYNVPGKEVRGEHAHKLCHQYLICAKGSIVVTADDGKNREDYLLQSPNKGLYLPPMVWGEQHSYSKDAILLVFASHYYDSNDYIRNYEEFVKMAKNI